MHRLELTAWDRQTDELTDRQQLCLIPSSLWWQGHNIVLYCSVNIP